MDPTRPTKGGSTGSLSDLLANDILVRQREDIARIEQMGFSTAGSAFAQVCLLKGELTPQEKNGARILSGPDGVALRAALDKLGYPAEENAVLSTDIYKSDKGAANSTNEVNGAGHWGPADLGDLAWAVEVVDPEVVIACDDKAARAICAAWRVQVPDPGVVVRVRGRRFIALGGFSAALGDSASKQLMWARLKRVRPLGDPL